VRIDQLFRRYYRPDLVSARLAHDEKPIKKALAEIGEDVGFLARLRPPKVELTGPTELTITNRAYTQEIVVEDRGSGLGAFEYQINGTSITPVAGRSEIRRRGDGRLVFAQQLILAPGRNDIDLVVPSRDRSVTSEPVHQVVVVKEPAAPGVTLYGLIVGINKYYDSALELNYAAEDARSIKERLERGTRTLFSRVKITPLIDKEAKKDKIVAALQDIAAQAQPQDAFFLYIAGHGFADSGSWHFVPQEVPYTNQDSLRSGSLSEDDLVKLLKSIQAQKSLIVIDSCYAGMFSAPQQFAMMWDQGGSRGLDEKAALDRLMRATGRAVLGASSDNQIALEGYQGHGLFTYVLLQGLSGDADRTVNGNNDGYVSILELKAYLDDRVPKLAEEVFHRAQVPMNNLYGPSFDLSRVIDRAHD
jgi:hypothetical protein